MCDYHQLVNLIKQRQFNDAIFIINGLTVLPTQPPNELSLLKHAVKSGDYDLIKALIDKGASLDKSLPGNDFLLSNALVLYNYNESTKIAKLLIDNGVDLHEEDSYHRRSIDFACNIYYVDNIKLLIDSGVDINDGSNNQYPIYTAIKHNYLIATKFLIDNGALLHDGIYSVMNVEMLNLLIEHYGRDIIHNKSKPLLTNLFNNHKHRLGEFRRKTIIKLIKLGVDINQSDEKGWTPLHYAVDKCDLKLVNLLLEYGADKSLVNNDGLNASQLASSLGFGRLARDIDNYDTDNEYIKEPNLD
jgi:ankyrin repeat protein